MQQALAPKTFEIFEAVSYLDCVKPYTLVGGTALSLQIANRKSEDLAFMLWAQRKGQKMEVNWPEISRQLSTIGTVENVDILDMDHVLYVVSGVNLSFYACPRFSPVAEPVACLNNIVLADKRAIGAMKMEVMLRRSKFRDYYDIYSLLMDGENIGEMIALALKYSQHRLKSRNILSLLTNPDRFVKDSALALLEPKYDISPQDIANLISSKLKENPI